MRGKAFKFGDNISTDHIAPGRLFHLRSDLQEFAKHVLEDADETFASRMQKGDFVVAGNNFGLGSSREHAPQIIKIAGVGAVIAKSFARIFYRNAINIGLLAIECDTDGIDAGDELDLDIKEGILKNLTKGTITMIEPLPDVMIRLLNDGALANDVGDERCRCVDGHGSALLHGVHGDLALHVPDHELCVSDDTGDGHTQVVPNLIELLDVRVGHDIAHCRPLVGGHDDPVLVLDTDCGCSCFKHFVCHCSNL